MKKISEIIKPFSAIIFGALFFLLYFNLLRADGEALAIGIIATIISAYYLAVGIVTFILGDKISGGLKKVFDIVSVSAFPLFVFIYSLLMVIDAADFIGPAGWIIMIVSLIGSILACAFCALAIALSNNKVLVRLGYLFASVFVLVLLMQLLFQVDGTPNVIGNIVIVELVVYILFASMLFSTFKSEEKASE